MHGSSNEHNNVNARKCFCKREGESQDRKIGNFWKDGAEGGTRRAASRGVARIRALLRDSPVVVNGWRALASEPAWDRLAGFRLCCTAELRPMGADPAARLPQDLGGGDLRAVLARTAAPGRASIAGRGAVAVPEGLRRTPAAGAGPREGRGARAERPAWRRAGERLDVSPEPPDQG